MAGVFGTLGKKWPDQWQSIGWQNCNCPACYNLHDTAIGVAWLNVDGECPVHPNRDNNRINLYSQPLGSNFLDNDMRCGCTPVGITGVSAGVMKPGVLMFELEVECHNPRCGAQDSTLALTAVNAELQISEIKAKYIKSTPCCDRPQLHFVHFSAQFHDYGSIVNVKLSHISFSEVRISSNFDDGRSVSALAEDLAESSTTVDNVPVVQAFVFDNHLYAKDNRRLYAFKQAVEALKTKQKHYAYVFEGLSEPEVPVQIVQAPHVWMKPRTQPNIRSPIDVFDAFATRNLFASSHSSMLGTLNFSSPDPRRQMMFSNKMLLGDIYYCQDSCKRRFRDGRPLSLMEGELRGNRKSIDDIPLIHVVEHCGKYFSVDNRRLYVFKKVFPESFPIPVVPKGKTEILVERGMSFEEKLTTRNGGRSIALR